MTSQPLPVPAAFAGFKRLSPVSYIYTPPTARQKPTVHDNPLTINPFADSNAIATSDKTAVPPPDVIIFPSWLDALPRHTAKYIDEYKKLCPNAIIIVITHSFFDDVKSAPIHKQRLYGAVVACLLTVPSYWNILLHSCSNGGALSIISVAKLYRERTGRPLPIRAQVIDSAPGKPSFWSDVDAVSTGIPGPWLLRLLARFLVFGSFLMAKIFFWLMKKPHPIMYLRSALNDQTLFAKDAPRAYVYSREDRMVGWRAVEEHIAEARQAGFKAQGVEFKGSGHVAHMMFNREKYFGVVEEVWRQGLEDK